jgi:hypothetical protein
MRYDVTGIPAFPLDDLEPLRDLIGSARVVGIGETAHHVREYQQLRNPVGAVPGRALDSYAEVPVAFAFDLVAAVPTITPLPPDER